MVFVAQLKLIFLFFQPTAESSLSLNSSNSSGSGGGTYGTLGRAAGGGMAEMMDEMAKTLARRRAAAENKDPSQVS